MYHVRMIERKNKREWVVEFGYIPNSKEMITWCNAKFGDGGRHRRCNWRYGWTDKSHRFYFRTEQDALFFVLRWS